jgi:hypothetical protein
VLYLYIQTAKVSFTSSDKNCVKHISHIAGDFLRLLLRLVHLGAEIESDMDFLGYEAYSCLNKASSKNLSQGKISVIAKKTGFAGSSKESLPLKAA